MPYNKGIRSSEFIIRGQQQKKDTVEKDLIQEPDLSSTLYSKLLNRRETQYVFPLFHFQQMLIWKSKNLSVF